MHRRPDHLRPIDEEKHMTGTGMKLEWNERFNVGIPEIDADHRRLFELANKLNEVVFEHKQKSEVEKILTTMLAEAETHFRREEQFFRPSAAAEVERHSVIHADIIAQLARLSAEIEVSKQSAIWLRKAAIAVSLLVTHLIQEDRKLASTSASTGRT